MACLYASDYGAAEPGFVADPASLAGFEDHARVLAAARNPGQLAAMKRQIERGETVTWCEQGYAWTAQPALDWGLGLALIAVLVPYAVYRLGLARVWRSRPVACAALTRQGESDASPASRAG